MAVDDLVLAMTGASGAAYGLHLLKVLVRCQRNVHLTISPAAAEVLLLEMDRRVDLRQFRLEDLISVNWSDEQKRNVRYHHYQDFHAGIASGSFLTGGMVICPCSGGTAGAIANGISQNLIHRAADVHLKEKRKLIVVPRETPLSLIQLRNLTTLAEAGAVVLPASPAFYTRPNSLQDCLDFVVARICDQLGVEQDVVNRWGE